MNADLEVLEIGLLTEGIFRHYGVDFRNYALPSLRRRVWNSCKDEGVPTITTLLDKVLHDGDAMERLFLQLSVNVTSMFRDPTFYKVFRERVIPLLRSHPFIRIWHAGCSTGEEVYSMAILLEEEGLYERARLYATDMNQKVLQGAQKGIFATKLMPEYGRNYKLAGGKGALSDYYLEKYEYALFKQSLRKNVVFAQHNLASDSSFNEFNVILCRNVMIYFDRTLQAKAHKLLHESLRRFGVLALGRRESLRSTPFQDDYEEIDREERIYRRSA